MFNVFVITLWILYLQIFVHGFQTDGMSVPIGSRNETTKCLEVHSCKNENPGMCKCDSECSNYDDCCYNSLHRKKVSHKHQTICEKNVVVKISCPHSWRNDSFRQKCENYSELADPLSSVPVTSVDTSETFKNYYCAICNGITENFLFWTVNVLCPLHHSHDHLSVEYLRSHLQYDANIDSWGVWLSKDRKIFRKCTLDYKPEDVIQKKKALRSCHLTFISDCPQSWKINQTVELCKDYLAPVFNGFTGYRNIYCAQCHNVELKNLDCQAAIIVKDEHTFYYGDVNQFKTSQLDSIQFSINMNDKSCINRQIYDPFFRKCRQLI